MQDQPQMISKNGVSVKSSYHGLEVDALSPLFYTPRRLIRDKNKLQSLFAAQRNASSSKAAAAAAAQGGDK